MIPSQLVLEYTLDYWENQWQIDSIIFFKALSLLLPHLIPTYFSYKKNKVPTSRGKRREAPGNSTSTDLLFSLLMAERQSPSLPSLLSDSAFQRV